MCTHWAVRMVKLILSLFYPFTCWAPIPPITKILWFTIVSVGAPLADCNLGPADHVLPSKHKTMLGSKYVFQRIWEQFDTLLRRSTVTYHKPSCIHWFSALIATTNYIELISINTCRGIASSSGQWLTVHVWRPDGATDLEPPWILPRYQISQKFKILLTDTYLMPTMLSGLAFLCNKQENTKSICDAPLTPFLLPTYEIEHTEFSLRIMNR